jgi:hypothetical protein
VVQQLHPNSSKNSSGGNSPSSSSGSSHSGKRGGTTTTTGVPELLFKELLGKPLARTGEEFEAETIADLWYACLKHYPACTPEDVIWRVNQKIKTNHFARRPIKSWVGFLCVAVPKSFAEMAS